MAVDAVQMGASVASDTASAPADAPTLTSEPTDAGTAVESHSDPAPTLGDSPTPESTDSEEAGEPESETPELNEDGTPKPSRADRQFKARLDALLKDPDKMRETLGPAIEPLLQQALESERKQRETQAEAERQAAQSQEAIQKRIQKFQDALGVPDAPGKPGTITSLQAELAETNRKIRTELVSPVGEDLDALTEQAAKAEARIAELTKANALAADLEDHIWSQLNEGGFGRVGEIPEMAGSPDTIRAFLNQKDVHSAHLILAETIRKAVAAQKDAEIATLKKSHASALAAVEADRNGWRVRAGGGEATTESGASGTISGGVIRTREQFMALPIEQRAKMRREQSALVDEIYRRST